MTQKNIYAIIKWVIIGVMLFVLLGFAILSNMDPNADYEGDHLPTTEKTVTIVLIDGLSKDIFEEELIAGNLPHIEKLISKSLYVDNGIVSFPSMTGYAFYPFITGMDAPTSGIYGLRWFDRSLDVGNLRNYVGRTNIQMNKDITNEYLNLFEYFDDHYTASINTYMNRGVNHSLKTGWAHTTAKYSRVSIFPALRAVPMIGKDISKDHFQHESLVTDLACNQLERNPKVQWITYPSLDAHHHVHGTDKTYYKLMHHIDEQLGRLIEKIGDLNQKDRMMVIVSDHGIADVNVNINIPQILKDSLGMDLERGPSAHLDTDELVTPLEDFIDHDGYFVINGNLSAYLYMKNQSQSGKQAWRQKLPGKMLEKYNIKNSEVDLPEFLAGIQGIDIVAYQRDDNKVVVRNESGIAEIESADDGFLTYNSVKGDPLGMGGYLAFGFPYSIDSLLSKTYISEYPYAIARLWTLMTEQDGPDIVLTTKEGFDLARDYEIFVDNYKGGHGGIHKSLLNVPFILAIPGADSRTINSARSEDVGATILDYLDMGTSYQLSGSSLLKE